MLFNLSKKPPLRNALRLGRKTTHSHSRAEHPVLHVPRAGVYRFGDANSARPVFRNLEWTIREDEGWAIVGPAGSDKNLLLEMFLGHMRLFPSPPSGLYPFLANARPPRDPYDCIAFVSFASRRRASGGGFYDYTARYGAVRDEDRLTLRESLFPDSASFTPEVQADFDTLTERLELKSLLDLPLITLSNGQTRRARIAREVLRKPEILLLDEPLTGLDVEHRPKLLRLLGEIHATRKPRVIMALRPQDPLPDWITHVAHVEDFYVRTGPRRSGNGPAYEDQSNPLLHSSRKPDIQKAPGKEIVSMKNVNVRYHDRHVLKNINWTVREGEKWHLQGANGSGKTTLLSLLTGDHPQSYTQAHLELFSAPRRRQPTVTLQRLVGAVSPELAGAFPRRLGAGALSVRDAVATGFGGTFAYRPRTRTEDARVDALLAQLGPTRWAPGTPPAGFDARAFALLAPGEQSVVLLLRALVNRPPLLILDEVFSGMDSRMIDVAKGYLRDQLDEKQAVIFVSHWPEEVPWDDHVVRKLRLENGVATEVV